MNRETKIGLVTGLTLIVLVGALLSSYLGRSRRAIAVASNSALGRSLRNRLLSPTGIAAVPQVSAPAAGPAGQRDSNSRLFTATAPPSFTPVVVRLPIRDLSSSQLRHAPLLTATSTPTTTAAVTPIPMAPTPGHSALVGVPRVPANHSLQGLVVSAANPQLSNRPVYSPTLSRPSPSAGATLYTIKRGDTLDRIAWRFYHNAGPVAIKRIVQANHGKISSARSVIRIGETLRIPVPMARRIHMARLRANSRAPTFRGLPHRVYSMARVIPDGNARAPKASAGTVIYRVRRGDTLFGIARRFLGAGSPANIRRLMKANHLHNAEKIYPGMILHIARH